MPPATEKRRPAKRRRCLNCPNFFEIPTKRPKHKKFCSDVCRWEFHRTGGTPGFIQLREMLPGFVRKEVLRQVADMREGFAGALAADLQDKMANVYARMNADRANNEKILREIAAGLRAAIAPAEPPEPQATDQPSAI